MCDVLPNVMYRCFHWPRYVEGPFGTSCCPARIVGFKAWRNAPWATGQSVSENYSGRCSIHESIYLEGMLVLCGTIQGRKGSVTLRSLEMRAPTWQGTSSIATCMADTGAWTCIGVHVYHIRDRRQDQSWPWRPWQACAWRSHQRHWAPVHRQGMSQDVAGVDQ